LSVCLTLNPSYVALAVLTITIDDAAKLSSKVRGELPGRGKEVKTGVKLTAEEAGAKFDSAVRSTMPCSPLC
jgi:hypothetical protein